MRQFNIYPNPFSHRISLEISSEEKETVIVSLLSKSGSIIRMFSWPLKPGINVTSLDGLRNLPAGEYGIQFKDTSGNILNTVAINKE